jgi:hypothetical protein
MREMSPGKGIVSSATILNRNCWAAGMASSKSMSASCSQAHSSLLHFPAGTTMCLRTTSCVPPGACTRNANTAACVCVKDHSRLHTRQDQSVNRKVDIWQAM